MNKQIDISLEFGGKQVDYRIPTDITFGRLIELMHVVLKEAKLPPVWTLRLKDKPIHLDKSDVMKDLPIGNGDVFLICPIEDIKGETL